MSARLRSAGWYGTSLAIVVVMLFPVYWMFAVSLKTPREIFKYPPVWYPHTPQFANFWVLIRDGDVWTIWNSFVIASMSTLFAMAFGTMCAYSIVRFRTGGENLAIWILSQRLLPPIAIVFPVFLIFAKLGLTDTYTGLILLYTAFALPYVIWLMRGYIQDIPVELENPRWWTARPGGRFSDSSSFRLRATASSPPPSSPSSFLGTSSCLRLCSHGRKC